MTNINEELASDLELALNLLTDYQRALYTLSAPGGTGDGKARTLQKKYGIQPYKQADGYRIMLETKDGKALEISDPTNIEDFGSKEKFATDYATGRTKLTNDPKGALERASSVEVCSEHSVPLNAEGKCHRCELGGDRD